MVNAKLKFYIENDILPEYNNFDKGHNLEHVNAVIKRSMECYEYLVQNQKNINENMVYTIAAYHDYGIKIERNGHHIHSKELVLKDKNLRLWFSQSQIETIAEACEDHSTSAGHDPRTIYGKIVADADKDRNPDMCLIRGYYFAKHYHPEWNFKQCIKDLQRELDRRFGENGVVKFYINTENASEYIKIMREYCNNYELLENNIIKMLKNELEIG